MEPNLDAFNSCDRDKMTKLDTFQLYSSLCKFIDNAKVLKEQIEQNYLLTNDSDVTNFESTSKRSQSISYYDGASSSSSSQSINIKNTTEIIVKQKVSKSKDKSSSRSKPPKPESESKKRKRESIAKRSKKLITDNGSTTAATADKTYEVLSKISQEIPTSKLVGSCELKPKKRGRPKKNPDSITSSLAPEPQKLEKEEEEVVFCCRCDQWNDYLPDPMDVDWVQCDKCDLWYHADCVDVDRVGITDKTFACPICEKEEQGESKIEENNEQELVSCSDEIGCKIKPEPLDQPKKEKKRNYVKKSNCSVESGTMVGFESWEECCLRLLDEIEKNDNSEPFRQPVDLIAYPDYLEFIETPMDLSTIRSKLLCGNYQKVKDFSDDMATMFANSRRYCMSKKSPVFRMGLKLHKLFRQKEALLYSESTRRANSSNLFHFKSDETQSKYESISNYSGKCDFIDKSTSNGPSRENSTDKRKHESYSYKHDSKGDFCGNEVSKPVCYEDQKLKALYDSVFTRTYSIVLTDLYSDPACSRYLQFINKPGKGPSSSSSHEKDEILEGNEDAQSNCVEAVVELSSIVNDASVIDNAITTLPPILMNDLLDGTINLNQLGSSSSSNDAGPLIKVEIKVEPGLERGD